MCWRLTIAALIAVAALGGCKRYANPAGDERTCPNGTHIVDVSATGQWAVVIVPGQWPSPDAHVWQPDPAPC
jgi:hypothetical protein